jgi:hypothetical protein
VSEQPEQPEAEGAESEQPTPAPELDERQDPLGGAAQTAEMLGGLARYGLPADGVENTGQQLLSRSLMDVGDAGAVQSAATLSLVQEPNLAQDASGATAGLRGPQDLTIPHPQAGPDSSMGELIQAVTERVERMEGAMRRRPMFKDVFIGQATSGNNATTGNITFKEMYVTGTGVVPFSQGRSSAGNATAVPFNGGGTVVSGTNLIILAFDNGNATKYAYLSISPPAAKITGVTSGSAPGPWVYKGVNTASANITIKNTMEPCNGSPGPLGVNVSGNGTVGNGTCIVQPIGNMTNFCPAYIDGNGTYWVTIPNSAQ